MALTRDQKSQILSEMTQEFNDAAAVSFVNFTGLTVEEDLKLRTFLREDAVQYRVLKKTLLKKVVTDSSIEGEVSDLPGNIAVAWTTQDDVTAAARKVHEFIASDKSFKKKLSLVGGVFENKVVGEEKINEIATIPSQQVLRGMFVNVINAPIQGFVSVLNQIAEKRG